MPPVKSGILPKDSEIRDETLAWSEETVIQRMNELRAQGLGFDRIAATLNEERIPTRTPGKRWYGFAVNQIIKRTAV
jgi:hypothetical protein